MNLYQWLIDNGHEEKLPKCYSYDNNQGILSNDELRYNLAYDEWLEALKQIEFNSREMIDMQTGLRHDVVILKECKR